MLTKNRRGSGSASARLGLGGSLPSPAVKPRWPRGEARLGVGRSPTFARVDAGLRALAFLGFVLAAGSCSEEPEPKCRATDVALQNHDSFVLTTAGKVVAFPGSLEPDAWFTEGPFKSIVATGERACGLTPDGRTRCRSYGLEYEFDNVAQIVEVNGDLPVCVIENSPESPLVCQWPSERVFEKRVIENGVQAAVFRGDGGCILSRGGDLRCGPIRLFVRLRSGGELFQPGWTFKATGVVAFDGLFATSCFVDGGDSVWCNQHAASWPRFGKESDAGVRVPVPPAVSVALAGDAGCALTVNGDVWCWGQYFQPYPRQLRRIDGLPLPARVIRAGGQHHCAILTDDTVWCWGDAGSGQRGSDRKADENVPTPLRGCD